MKKAVIHFLLLMMGISKSVFAQNSYVEGVIISSSNYKPIANVNIQDKANLKGTTSDSLGKFRLNLSAKNILLTFSCVGYENYQLFINSNSFIVIKLVPKTDQLAEITVRPSENPAWEIIRRTLANASINNPTKIQRFKATHYSKIGLSGEIFNIVQQNSVDSTLNKDRSLFIVENLGYYYQKNKNQKDIINFWVSSFPKNYPINLITNSQVNPQGFYDEFIQINLNQLTSISNGTALSNQRFYVNPIHDKKFNQYDFLLTDSLMHEADTTYIILFRPKANTNFNGMKGIIKINTNRYAIEEVSASNADTTQNLRIDIKQNYIKKNYTWYPELRTLALNYTFTIKNKETKFTYQIDDHFSNFETDFDDKEVNFDGTNRLILPKSDTISRIEFDQKRVIYLKKKELQLYAKSEIINKLPFFQKVMIPGMAILNTAFNNGFVVGPLFLLYNQFDYNQHEKLRVGIGLQNDLLKNPRWRFYGATAYGLDDQKIKYEGIISFHITKNRYNKIEFYGGNDLRRPGQNPLLYANYILPQKPSLNLGSKEYLLDNYKNLGIALFFKPFSWTQFKVFHEKETRTPISYTLSENINTNYFHTGLSMRFARKETINRTGYNESILNPYFPIIRLNVSNFNSNILTHSNFWKADVFINHQIRTKRIGKTITNLSAGNSWGILPFQYLFNNLSVPLNIWGSNGNDGFQKLSTANLGYNNYLSLAVFHDFEKSILRINSRWFQPEFIIGNKVAYGRLTQTAPIVDGNQLKDIKSGVFEASLNIRNLITIKISGVAIGLGLNFVYDYSPQFFGTKRFGIRPFILPVFF